MSDLAMAKRGRRLATMAPPLWLSGALLFGAIAFASLALILPNTYTNKYVIDCFYLLNAGYLVHHGYVPHVDFVWQFGGYEIYLIDWAMRLFGPTFKAIEQAIVIGFFICAALFYCGIARQARLATFALLLVLLSATSLTWSPFEDGGAEIFRHSYSMYYNRLCWALAITCYATVLLSDQPLRQVELFVCAAAAFLILVTKLTFAILLVPAAAPLLYRNGLKGLLHCALYGIAMIAMGWAVLGYGPEAYMKAPGDLSAVAGVGFIIDWAFRKLFYNSLYNFFGLAIAAGSIAYLWVTRKEGRWLAIKLSVLAAILPLGMLATLTTGSLDYFIAATTPMIAFVVIMAADEGLHREDGEARMFTIALAVYALTFMTPYLMNVLVGLRGQARGGELSLFKSGTLAGLIVERPETSQTPLFTRPSIAIKKIGDRLHLEQSARWMGDYEWQYAHADGLALLSRLPNIRQRKVLSFYSSTWPFVLQSQPVLSFPLGASHESPIMKALNAIPADIDTVLVLRDDRTNELHSRFLPSLRQQFDIQDRSTMWDLYIRRPSV
ncbi:hypothetical protein [Sphingosinicella sp. BN140058]|uniref:hypothetical protein n=1 Tax=Sphingosinicella sp. BN140058 TaxID=1892855 RepID=UPI00101266C3|nr:hypothetical protein [Sphingosinicella sp. BN140058]QAY77039.1 hypothetical protein ETR14_11425 [Sphingosinicella sp. BN140058]